MANLTDNKQITHLAWGAMGTIGLFGMLALLAIVWLTVSRSVG